MEFSGKTAVFFGRIWLDWGNTAWADMAGLGFIEPLKPKRCNKEHDIVGVY